MHPSTRSWTYSRRCSLPDRIFAIGLGKPDQLDVAELEQMASRPEYFYLAPDGEDLRATYQTIAVEIPCPAQSFWGRR